VPVAAVYISELAGARGRGRFVLLYELIFPVGLVAAGFVGAWLVPRFGWQSMFIVGAAPALLALMLQWLVPESPRWLAVVGRNAEAEAALALIERETEASTGQKLPPPQPVVATQSRAPSWADLFGAHYLPRTLVVWLIWFTAYLINYGLAIWLPTLYHTVFKLPLAVSLQYGLITQVVGFVGAAICALTIDRFGRRSWFALAFTGAAAALLGLWVDGAGKAESVLIYVSLAYFFVSTINLGVYLYTPKLYPTRSRALAVGTATAWLRLASIIGPMVVGYMVGTGLQSVFLAFAIIAIIAAVITVLFAVETKGRVLEEVSP
jgi:putative MFS transporter